MREREARTFLSFSTNYKYYKRYTSVISRDETLRMGCIIRVGPTHKLPHCVTFETAFGFVGNPINYSVQVVGMRVRNGGKIAMCLGCIIIHNKLCITFLIQRKMRTIVCKLQLTKLKRLIRRTDVIKAKVSILKPNYSRHAICMQT